MMRALIYCLALLCTPVFPASITLSPSQYANGGYSTIVWNGVGPCLKSSIPVYSIWDETPDASGGRSVAPSVSTVFRLECADGTATASLTVGNVAPPVITPVGAAHTCYPDISIPVKARTVTVPALSNGDNRLTLWTCRTSTGYKNERWSWKLADIAPWMEQALSGVLDEPAARAWVVANAGGADRAYSAELEQYAAKAVVATNGTSTTRPVYPLNADGTRGTTALAGIRAAVGSSCDITKRVGSTSYYAVTGGVTLCTFTAPAGVND